MLRSLLPLCLVLLLAIDACAADIATADALLKDRDPAAAAAVAAVLEARPGDPEARVLQVRLLLQQREAEAAVDAAEELVDDFPDHALAHLWLGNAYGNRIGQLGTFGQGLMAPKLRNAFERAIELDPGLHEARAALLEYYLQAPAIVGGSQAKARAQAAELQRRDPPSGHYALARIAQHEQRLDDARRHYLDAYAARPDSATFRMAAGLIHQETKAWDKAFEVFERWTRDEPAVASAWYQLGRTAVLSGQRLDDGAAAFRRFLAMPELPGQPGHKHGWWRLGQALAQAGDTAGARAAFEKALSLDPALEEARAELAKL